MEAFGEHSHLNKINTPGTCMKIADIRKYNHNCDKLDPSGEHKPYVPTDGFLRGKCREFANNVRVDASTPCRGISGKSSDSYLSDLVIGCPIHIDVLDGTEGYFVQLASFDVYGASCLLVRFPEAAL
ncbi:hypothetical protein T265_15537, partial [Opisthorchis viverrini]